MNGRWQPQPDPCPDGQDRPGIAAHRHPPDRLHYWVFLQDQVWVDYWGNEHQIDRMPRRYALNVIGFCRRQATRIFILATCADPDEAGEQIEALRATRRNTVDWLETTPLMKALRRRASEVGER